MNWPRTVCKYTLKLFKICFWMYNISHSLSFCPTHSEAGLCPPWHNRMVSGQLRQFFAKLPRILVMLLENSGGRFPHRKLWSKNKLLQELPNFAPYSLGIWPDNWLRARLIEVRFRRLTKLIGKWPRNRLPCTSSSWRCVSPDNVVISIAVKRLTETSMLTTCGKVSTSWLMAPVNLLELKSNDLRFTRFLREERCPDSKLWLRDRVLRLVGNLGKFP